MESPVGVSVLAIVSVLAGLLGVLLGVWPFFDEVAPISTALWYLVSGTLNAALGFGLWRLREWARLWMLIFTVIGLVLALVSLLASSVSMSIVRLVSGPIIIAYLSQVGVREAFQQE
jgi:uncharacterized membrane protein HdeD (DUF308 family)